MKVLINLNSIDKVKNFVNEISKTDSDKATIDLVSGRYVIDARSIMGIFSLDLSKPIEAIVTVEDDIEKQKVLNILEKYKIK